MQRYLLHDHLEEGALGLAYGTSVNRGGCWATSSIMMVLVLRCVCTKMLPPTTAAWKREMAGRAGPCRITIYQLLLDAG